MWFFGKKKKEEAPAPKPAAKAEVKPAPKAEPAPAPRAEAPRAAEPAPAPAPALAEPKAEAPKAPAAAFAAREYKRSPVHSKPHMNVCTAGNMGVGKTTLTAAITTVLNQRYGLCRPVMPDEIDNREEERELGCSICVRAVEYETPRMHFAHFDLPGHPDHLDHFFEGAALSDVAVVVIEPGEEGPISLKERLLLLRQAGFMYIVVFINFAEMVGDEDLLELLEMDVREVLNDAGYDENAPCVWGSALEALEDPAGEWGDGIVELVECIEGFGKVMDRSEEDRPFAMQVQSMHYVPLKGMAVIGRVERGTLRVNDKVELIGWSDEPVSTMAESIQIFGQPTDTALPGDYIGVLLRGVSRDRIRKGQMLAAPGTIRPRTKFRAQAYILTCDEGGRRTPFVSGFRADFYILAARAAGRIALPEDVEWAGPGDSVEIIVELERPTVIEEGLRFAFRNGSTTVGLGRITQIPE